MRSSMSLGLSSIKIMSFGLPQLEAMSYKLPVASSSASCLPEVLKDAALFFNPQDKMAMAQALKGVNNIPGRLEFIQEHPFAVVVDYANTPRAYEAVYQTLSGNQKSARPRPSSGVAGEI